MWQPSCLWAALVKQWAERLTCLWWWTGLLLGRNGETQLRTPNIYLVFSCWAWCVTCVRYRYKPRKQTLPEWSVSTWCCCLFSWWLPLSSAQDHRDSIGIWPAQLQVSVYLAMRISKTWIVPNPRAYLAPSPRWAPAGFAGGSSSRPHGEPLVPFLLSFTWLGEACFISFLLLIRISFSPGWYASVE